MPRRLIDIAQLIIGVLASYGAVWGLGALSLVAQSPGATMTPARAVAIAGLLAMVPGSMWVTREVGKRAVHLLDGRRVTAKTDPPILSATLVSCALYAYAERAASGGGHGAQYELMVKEILSQALRDNTGRINELQLPDTSEEQQRNIYSAIKQYRAVAA